MTETSRRGFLQLLGALVLAKKVPVLSAIVEPPVTALTVPIAVPPPPLPTPRLPLIRIPLSDIRDVTGPRVQVINVTSYDSDSLWTEYLPAIVTPELHFTLDCSIEPYYKVMMDAINNRQQTWFELWSQEWNYKFQGYVVSVDLEVAALVSLHVTICLSGVASTTYKAIAEG